MPRSRLLLAALAVLAAGAAVAAPKHVVSINLCTDQLALMLADEGQLVSVSALSLDPRLSVMAEAAALLETNHGRAEEIYLLEPDLVLAGEYTARAAVDMLSRLGADVVTFSPATSIEDVRTNIRKMGEILGSAETASRLIDRFDASLASRPPSDRSKPSALVYEAQGWASGRRSLAGAVLDAAGFTNLVKTSSSVMLPLELVIAGDPDLVITSSPHAGAARGEEMLGHPALRAMSSERTTTSSAWVCGTPALAREVARLRRLRDRIAARQ